MSKQLQTIIEKAHKTGYANKNGRMNYGYISTLEINGKHVTTKIQILLSLTIGELTL